MPKRFKPECPYCGSHEILGWYDEQGIRYHVECADCGAHKEVFNIKYIEAFPDWFEILDEEETDE